KSTARRRTDQGEPRQIQAHATRVWSLVDDNIQFEILHRGIEIFLDRLLQAMDFIDEQNVSFFEVRQQPREVARLFDGWPARTFDTCAHGFGDDMSQSCL